MTAIGIEGEDFTINGKLTYAEVPGGNPEARGLLMNARFIQGIFDDRRAPERFARFGWDRWDAERHTDELIAALPEWHRYGLRAITVGFQGGMPVFTIDNSTIENNPFGSAGTDLDPDYAARMDRLIRGADAAGVVVIVSFLYGAQCRFLKDGAAVRNAVKTGARFLKDGGYQNVLIEVANEQDVNAFRNHPIVHTAEGAATLIDLARAESGGIPTSCSSIGKVVHPEIARASDYILIHGNQAGSRTFLYNLVQEARRCSPGKPVVCNEDSPRHGMLVVAIKTHSSWGYYNNSTKQEPPADWTVTRGEDMFFASRLAKEIGIEVPSIPQDEQYYFQGFEPHATYDGKRWLRLASLYPETIDYVDFFDGNHLLYTSYSEPFLLYHQRPWVPAGVEVGDSSAFRAEVHLRDGTVIERLAPAREP